MVLVLRGRAKPIAESRRIYLVPCGLDDAGNSLVLQRRRRDLLLLVELVVAMLLVGLVYTSVGGRLRDRAVRLTMFDRLIEQDEVLLWRQVQMGLMLQLVRGWCRQAGGTGGRPC